MGSGTVGRKALAVLGCALGIAPTFLRAQAAERPPAIPLVTHNPYFSLWSDDNKLTDGPTRHWTGHPQPMGSLIRVDGSAMRLMGPWPRDVPAMEQSSVRVTPTHTVYEFQGKGVAVTLTFFTPAFPDDLDVLSRPVTYLTWTVRSTDSANHKVDVLFDASPSIATSAEWQPVTETRSRTQAMEVLSTGTQSQAVLNRSGDDLRIDWGYFHVAVPKAAGAQEAFAERGLEDFAKGQDLPGSDAFDAPTGADRSPHLDAEFSLGAVGSEAVSRHLLLSYTEGYAIQYMQRNLRPWWARNGMTVPEMLDAAEHGYDDLNRRGDAFDRELATDMTGVGGEHYAYLTALAYRQAVAAHALVADANGDPMLFEKENFSNGDTGTVDVIYPCSPIFLFFNPRLLEAEVLPVLEYAAMPNRWHFPFAPHDIGQYPLADGQSYGGGEKTEENQMPVEESGNLLLMVDALAQKEGNAALAERFWPQLTQWAQFLREHGLDPENQLTTDDFAGHVMHNSNLSAKAIEGVAAYADLARRLHHESEARQNEEAAKKMAGQWVGLAKEGDHFKLAYNSPGTWSQKYNLVWDQVLHFNLFPASVRKTEVAFYLTRLNQYGLPLDSRRDYTKLDWELWTASLEPDRATFDRFMDPIYTWTNETSSRIPLTDWYDTKTGKQQGFQARSVVGGVYMKALSDEALAKKWEGRARTASK